MIEAVICDYARTIVDMDFNPPKLFPGAEKVLRNLKARGLKMALVSTGQDPELRRKEFADLRLDRFFAVLDVVGPGGTKDFQPILDQLQVEATACVVVGDRVRSEILQGNKIGTTTIWLKNGKFSGELPETPEEKPDYTIHSLAQLVPIIDSIGVV